ncbi:MAG TPA: hypothetical protein DEP28_00235 [Bacteroidetes bacterium]|nr:hypothetical protein [Bacteroidota bacterium]
MKTQIRKLRNLFFIFVMTFFVSVPAQSQWVQTSGVFGGSIFNIHKNGEDYYSATSFGLYKSTDEGENWEYNTSLNKSVRDIKTFFNKLYIATYSGVSISSNNGESWDNRQVTTQNTPAYVLEKNGDTLFAGTASGLFISSDSGKTWVLRNLSGYSFQTIKFIDNKLFVAIRSSSVPYMPYGISLSTNNGLSFDEYFLGYRLVTSILQVNSDIYAGTFGGDGLHKSTDGGQNWFQTTLTNVSINSLDLIDGKIYVGTTGGFYYSTDNGQTWLQENLISSNVFKMFKHNEIRLYGSFSNGIYKYDNNLNNWRNVGVNNGTDAMSFTKLGNNIFAGTVTGVHRSTNLGLNWTLTNLSGSKIYQIITYNEKLIAGGDIGLRVSANSGTSWNSLNINENVSTVSAKNGRMFAGVHEKIYRSTNEGINWSISDLNSSIFTLLDTNGIVLAGTSNGIFYSTNTGNSWQLSNLNGIYIRQLYFKDGIIYAGGNQSGLYKSTDMGNNWTFLGGGLHVHGIESINNNLFIGTGNGVSRSTNGGVNWISINEGFTGSNIQVWELYIFENYLFAGLLGRGIWRRPLSEIVGVESISSVIPEKYSLSQNYPNPFNPVTKIRFNIPSVANNSKTEVLLDVYDVSGKLVKQLYKGQLSGGEYEFEFDGTGLNSGVYFYRLQSENFSETRKMVLVK